MSIIALVTCVASLLAPGGCTESIRQYVRLGDWKRPADEPVVLSGSPSRDAAAYQAGTEQLTEADWAVLEKIAPRAVWDRIRDARRAPPGEQAASRPSGAAAASRPAEPARDVPTQTLPDGKVEILYELRHYGGTSVSSVRDGGAERRNITLAPADLKPIVEMVGKHLAGKGDVVALPSRNTLVITCAPEMVESVLRLLDRVDTRPRQVEITARIFEVSHDFDFQLGAKAIIKHISSDNKQALASAFSAKDFVGSVVRPAAGNVPDPGAALRLMQVFADAGLTLDATFQALADTGLIKVVSTPRMAVRAGQTAYMLAGQELPILSAKIANEQLITEKITFKPVGVQLYVTPQTIGPDSVKLHVVTIVSALSGFSPLPPMDNRNWASGTPINPVLDSREAETYVSVRDAETLVIGGLRMVRTVTREQKVPGLGDLALIEWLFKNHRSQKVINDLYFFVTPSILH